MNNLQKQILLRYKQKFPNHTLKQISKTTGIQNTRVFRIFNGHEMKLSEYQIFTDILTERHKVTYFEKLIHDSSLVLSELNLKRITSEIESLLKMQRLTNNYPQTSLISC